MKNRYSLFSVMALVVLAFAFNASAWYSKGNGRFDTLTVRSLVVTSNAEISGAVSAGSQTANVTNAVTSADFTVTKSFTCGNIVGTTNATLAGLTVSGTPLAVADATVGRSLTVNTNLAVGARATVGTYLTAATVTTTTFKALGAATFDTTVGITGVATASGGLTIPAGKQLTVPATNVTFTGAFSGTIAGTSVCVVVNGLITAANQ